MQKWYGVAAKYKAVHVNTQRRRNLWERMIFIVQAESPEDAREKAEKIAQEKQHEYVAADGDLLRWMLHGGEDVKEILDDELTNGSEVYWDFFERVDKRSNASP